MFRNSENQVWSEPEHHRRAEQFIEYGMVELARFFPKVRFDVMNVTDDDIASSPWVAEAARLEGLEGVAREIEDEGMKADAESIYATQVRAFLYGDIGADIERATNMLTNRAKQLKGIKTDDTGIVQSGISQSMDKVLGHAPQHEDALRLMRAIGYKFT